MTVSICMITYNHEKYIKEAIQSILMQETEFSIELIISNDCSTDNSDQIIVDCIKTIGKEKNIKYYRHEKNLGMMQNFIFSLQKCTGKYIALCEGDDYWTDPYKLQKQVDFLEVNPKVSLCCHNHFFLRNNHLQKANKNIKDKVKLLSLENYLLKPFFQTGSIVFRSQYFVNGFPDWYGKVLAGDRFLVLFISMHGQIVFLNEAMSVYRINPDSVTQNRAVKIVGENYNHHLELFNIYSDRKFERTLKIVSRKCLCNFSYIDKSYFSKVKFYLKNFTFIIRNNSIKQICYLSYKYILPKFNFNGNKRFI